jgi:hypothetical protein
MHVTLTPMQYHSTQLLALLIEHMSVNNPMLIYEVW